MSLIVENGEGLKDADVYFSFADLKDDLDKYGVEIEESELNRALLNVTTYINSFEEQFVGKRLTPEQALAFPRVIESDLVQTTSLKKAVTQGLVLIASGVNLLSTFSKDDFVKKEKIEGAVEVQYDSNGLYKFHSDSGFAIQPTILTYLKPYFINNSFQLKVYR